MNSTLERSALASSVLLAQRHRYHGRHCGQPGRAIARDRVDIGARLEPRQQHDGGVRRAGELGERQRVHVVERRRDQVAVAVEAGCEPRLHHPDVALVREHDAFWRTGRARGVEEHRWLAVSGNHGLKRAGIEKIIEPAFAALAEHHSQQVRRAILTAWLVAEHQLCAAVGDDEMNGLARKAIVHRHGDEACAHDAVVRRKILGAIHRQDGNAVTALETTFRQRSCHRHAHRIELRVSVLAGRLFAAEIDDRDFGKIAVADDQVAEVGKSRTTHQADSKSRLSFLHVLMQRRSKSKSLKSGSIARVLSYCPIVSRHSRAHLR